MTTTVTNDSMTKTLDGMSNVLARLDRSAGLPGMQGCVPGMYITSQPMLLNAMYRSNWLARRIVDCVADDMARDGIELSIPSDKDAIAAFEDCEKETGLWDDITDGVRWGRLYGGAIAVKVIDGQDPATPLDINTVGVGQYKGLMVFDRWEVTPSTECVTEFGRDFGLPVYYTINETSVRIHYSRVMRFLGSPIPKADRKVEKAWSASVLEKVVDELGYVKAGDSGVANLLKFAHLRVFNIKDYREMIASGGSTEEMVIKHFTMIAKMQSLMGATILDGEDAFHTTTYSFTGIKDVQQGQIGRVSGASGIPQIKLTGESPGGLNANGESMERTYYDEVSRDMERDLRPQLSARLIPVIFKSKLGYVPDEWSFQFRPLYQMRDSEKATVVKDEATTIKDLYEATLLNRSVALHELKALGEKYGRFATLTKEEIKNIVNDPPTAEDVFVQEGFSRGEETS